MSSSSSCRKEGSPALRRDFGDDREVTRSDEVRKASYEQKRSSASAAAASAPPIYSEKLAQFLEQREIPTDFQGTEREFAQEREDFRQVIIREYERVKKGTRDDLNSDDPQKVRCALTSFDVRTCGVERPACRLRLWCAPLLRGAY